MCVSVRVRGGKRGRHSQNTMESRSEIKHKKVERQEEEKREEELCLSVLCVWIL